MESLIKPLLLVNRIYDEFFFQDEVFVIYEDKLEQFLHSGESQSDSYKNTHVVIKFNEKTKQLVKKYLPALKEYIYNKNNQIELEQFASYSEKYICALETNQEINSVKSALEVLKDAPTFEIEVFAYFLRAISPIEYLPQSISILVKDSSDEEILNKLDAILK